MAALRQIDRKRQSHRTRADHDDRMFGDIRAGPILVGMTAIAELGLCLSCAMPLETSAGQRRAAC